MMEGRKGDAGLKRARTNTGVQVAPQGPKMVKTGGLS